MSQSTSGHCVMPVLHARSWLARGGRAGGAGRAAAGAGRALPAQLAGHDPRARARLRLAPVRTALRAHVCTHANSSLPAPKSSPHVTGSTPRAGSKGALFGGAVPVAHALLHNLMTCAGDLRMHMRARGMLARATAAPAPQTRAAASAMRVRRAARPTPPPCARRPSWRAAPGPPARRPRTNRRHDCYWDQLQSGRATGRSLGCTWNEHRSGRCCRACWSWRAWMGAHSSGAGSVVECACVE